MRTDIGSTGFAASITSHGTCRATCMHGDATGYVFYNGQSALKIQDSGEVTLMHVGAL